MKLEKVVFDINVIAKLFFKEKHSQVAEALVGKLLDQGSEVLLPSFSRVEFYSLVRKKESINHLSSDIVKRGIKLFNGLNLSFVYEDETLFKDAYDLAVELEELVIYDCLYLALAIESGAPFVSADERFVNKAKQVYPTSYPLATFR